MKKYFLFVATILIISTFTFTRCAKDEKAPDDPTPAPVGTTPAGGFTFTPAGSSAVVANEAYFIPAFNNIVATKIASSSTVDITLDDLSTGGHTISPGITLVYTAGSTTYTSKSGVVTISAKTGTLLSGSFSVALNGGTLTGISGQFTDISQK
jgi:hypothetical protein